MPKNQPDQNYIDFMSRSEEEVYLAILDKIGVKLPAPYIPDDNDTSWACDIAPDKLT